MGGVWEVAGGGRKRSPSCAPPTARVRGNAKSLGRGATDPAFRMGPSWPSFSAPRPGKSLERAPSGPAELGETLPDGMESLGGCTARSLSDIGLTLEGGPSVVPPLGPVAAALGLTRLPG